MVLALQNAKQSLEELKRASRKHGSLKEKTQQTALAKELESARALARDRVAKVILEFPNESGKKEVEDAMWRYCYYKEIERFRTDLADLKSKVVAAAANPSNSTRAAELNKLRRKRAGEFLHFLDNASQHYKTLVNQIEAAVLTAQTLEQKNQFQQSLYSSFLYLGDLARYREMYDDARSEKCFDSAQRFYEKCVDIDPSMGWAHNQLAVIAQAKGDLCIALYRYIRSICVKKPFPNAQRNAELVFDVAGKQLSKTGLGASPVLTAPMTAKQRTQLLKDCLVRFVLFQQYVISPEKASQALDRNSSAEELLAKFGSELPFLIKKWAINRELQIALVVCSFYSLMEASKKNHPTSTIELGFRMFSTLLFHFCDMLSWSPKPVSSTTTSTLGLETLGSTRSTLGRPDLLVPITISLDLIQAAVADDRLQFDLSSPDMDRIWSAIGSSWQSLLCASQTFDSRKSRKDLWEEGILQGFLPLEKIPHYVFNGELSSSSPDSEDSIAARAAKVRKFCEWMANRPHKSSSLPFDLKHVNNREDEDESGTGDDFLQEGHAATISAAQVLEDETPTSDAKWMSRPANAIDVTQSSFRQDERSSIPVNEQLVTQKPGVRFEDQEQQHLPVQEEREKAGAEEDDEDEEEIIVLAPQVGQNGAGDKNLDVFSRMAPPFGDSTGLGMSQSFGKPFYAQQENSFPSPPSPSVLNGKLKDLILQPTLSASSGPSSRFSHLDNVYGGAFPTSLTSPGTFNFQGSNLEKPSGDGWGSLPSTADSAFSPQRHTSTFRFEEEKLVSPADFANLFVSQSSPADFGGSDNQQSQQFSQGRNVQPPPGFQLHNSSQKN